MSDPVTEFRRYYREELMPEAYNGPRHFLFTVGMSLLIVIVCVSRLQAVTPWEWLALPLTFLYANLAEYLGHRGPMHHRFRGLEPIFERHARQHHRFFTNRRMAYDNNRDYRAVLFPPLLMLFFLAVFAVPPALLLLLLFSPNVAYLYVATAVAYFLNYELLHFAYHEDGDAWASRLPGMARLRMLHTHHHDPHLMQQYNFNITYPIGDWLFGTLYRPERSPDSGPVTGH